MGTWRLQLTPTGTPTGQSVTLTPAVTTATAVSVTS